MRLVGDDLELISYEEIKEIAGNGINALRADNTIIFPAFFIIKEVTADEIFLNNHKQGDLYYSLNGSEILSYGTIFTYIKESEYLADIKAFNMQLNYSEIDLTTIDDEVNKYDTTIQDCKGSMSFQVSSENMANGGLVNRFIKMSFVDNTGRNTISEINNNKIFIRGYVNSTEDMSKKILLFAQIELFDYNITGNMGVAQDYTSSFRLKNIDPLLFVISE